MTGCGASILRWWCRYYFNLLLLIVKWPQTWYFKGVSSICEILGIYWPISHTPPPLQCNLLGSSAARQLYLIEYCAKIEMARGRAGFLNWAVEKYKYTIYSNWKIKINSNNNNKYKNPIQGFLGSRALLDTPCHSALFNICTLTASCFILQPTT